MSSQAESGTEKILPIGVTFIEKYYSMFAGDKSKMSQLYHPNSTFAMSIGNKV